MSRVLPVEVGARVVGGELRDVWRCGYATGAYPGGYPAGFLERAEALFRGSPRLHVCSGGVEPVHGAAIAAGVPDFQRVDLFHDDMRPRPDGVRGVRPSVLADARALPYRGDVFGVVMLDPPWSPRFTEELYALGREDYPNPFALIEESLRVTRPFGFVGVLHLVVPPTPPGARRVARIEVVACNLKSSRLRWFSVFQKVPRMTGSPVARARSPAGTGKGRRGHAGPWTLAHFGAL